MSSQDPNLTAARPAVATAAERSANAARGQFGGLSRRGLLAAVGAAAALPWLGRAGLAAGEAEIDDARVVSDTVPFPGRSQPLRGFLARPKTGGKRPSILIATDQRGTGPFYRQLARRLALEGFNAFVPDLLAPFNLEAEASDDGRDLLRRMAAADIVGNYEAAVEFLEKQPDAGAATGGLGFQWGGLHIGQMAIENRAIKAAVLFYVAPVALDKIAGMKVPIQLHYAGNEEGATTQMDNFERKLIGYGKIYEQYTYAGVFSAFADPSAGSRYNKDAADLAWERMMLFDRKYLRA